MNLKFMDDIFQTIEFMKTGIYYLGLIAAIHTVTFTLYLGYKYSNETSPDNSKKEIEPDTEIKNDVNSELSLTQTSEIQMEEVVELSNKAQLQTILLKKKEELDNLILQLDTVYDNIGDIRERLEELNNKPVSS
jgi:hypothetical protein